MERITSDTHAMMQAYVASLRSEDPHRKVGAIALDANRYVLGCAYNGLSPGLAVKDEFWNDRESRRRFVCHAEQNLCALFTRGSVHTVAITTCPCSSCATLLVAHGVRRILYGEPYSTDDSSPILDFHSVVAIHVPLDQVKRELAELCLRS